MAGSRKAPSCLCSLQTGNFQYIYLIMFYTYRLHRPQGYNNRLYIPRIRIFCIRRWRLSAELSYPTRFLGSLLFWREQVFRLRVYPLSAFLLPSGEHTTVSFRSAYQNVDDTLPCPELFRPLWLPKVLPLERYIYGKGLLTHPRYFGKINPGLNDKNIPE